MSGWDDDEVAVAEAVERNVPLADGIHYNVPFDAYLLQDRVSKSGLWTAYNRSPAHARVQKTPTNAMKKGSATHTVLLEPDEFTRRYKRGPEDRRGNKWKLLVEEYGEFLLTAGEYDDMLVLRDALKDIREIKMLTGNGAHREVTVCAVDPETGLKTKARADAYVPGDGIMVEVKTTADARPEPFLRVVKDLGYHVGEAHYTKTWRDAGGIDFKCVIFIALETEAPYGVKIYELDADAIAEGEAIRAKAMATWAECVAKGVWPAYSTVPEALSLRKFDYRETVPIGDAG